MAASRLSLKAVRHSPSLSKPSSPLLPSRIISHSTSALLIRHASSSFLSANPGAVGATLAIARRTTAQLGRRNFSSSQATAGWIPSWPTYLGGKGSPAPSPEPAPVAEPEIQVVAATPPPPPPPTPVETISPVEEVTSTVSDVISGHFIQAGSKIISTGTLDLSALAGSWGPHPIMRMQSLFLQLHESLPFVGYTPWYIVVPVVTLALRLLLFPFMVRSQSNAARMAIIQPKMLEGMEKVKAAKAAGDVMGQQAAMGSVQQLMRENNVNPLKSLAFPLAQASIFMTTFFALRGLATADIVSLTQEGFAWVQDLSAKDPYWALPLTSSALTIATLEFGMDESSQTPMMKNAKKILRGVMIISIPFIASFPAILLLYWTTNNFISLIQSQLLKQDSIRAMLGIPKIPPKPQPGQVGYVKEPSFTEAFRNVQTSMSEKWEETKVKAEEEARIKRLRDADIAPTQVYVPRAPVKRKAGPLNEAIESIGGESGQGEIIAERKANKAAEDKARRLLLARQRRR
ncbi:hypothetical protein T439DRAFT_378669 [Meredithblackwellia eburnea MCA 4105]